MPRVTIPDLQRMKREKQKIVMMTVYDFQMARIIDRAGVDIILVGDSGGRNLLGHEDANSVTMDEMVLMARSVSRGTKRAPRSLRGNLRCGPIRVGDGSKALAPEAGPQNVQAMVRRGVPQPGFRCVRV